jgi:hypothetical protein
MLALSILKEVNSSTPTLTQRSMSEYGRANPVANEPYTSDCRLFILMSKHESNLKVLKLKKFLVLEKKVTKKERYFTIFDGIPDSVLHDLQELVEQWLVGFLIFDHLSFKFDDLFRQQQGEYG